MHFLYEALEEKVSYEKPGKERTVKRPRAFPRINAFKIKGIFCAVSLLFLFSTVKLYGNPASNTTANSTNTKNAPAKKIRSFAVQLCSRRDQEKAKKIQKELTKSGIPSYVVEKEVKGSVWYRVRIGFFRTKLEARNRAREAMKAVPEISDFLVISVSSEEFRNQQ